MTPRYTPHFTFPHLHRQPVAVAFDAPPIVSDTGLLSLRDLDQRLGYLDDLARRLPDPRAQDFVTHPAAEIVAQQVYQILADYADCNDANCLRTDPLFQTLAGALPKPQQPLACGSTLARFQYAFTRRQRELPEEDRPANALMYQARSSRIRILNDFLVETFIRTRPKPPTYVILDIDPTDDPAHGRQILSGYHGYYRQHQYFPLLVPGGQSGFPLAAWLRPGTAGGACGAVEALEAIVTALRQAWPGVLILVRGDCSLANPGLYEFCEGQGLLYAFGYAKGAVLQHRTAAALADLELYYHFYRHREPHERASPEPGRLPGGGLVAFAADCLQGGNHAAGLRATLCRDQPVGSSRGHLPGVLCGAWRGARTTDRRVEERGGPGSLVGSQFSCQCVSDAVARGGLRVSGVVAFSLCGGGGGGAVAGGDVAKSFVEGRGVGRGEGGSDLVSRVGVVARPGVVGSGASGRGRLHAAAAGGLPSRRGSGFGGGELRAQPGAGSRGWLRGGECAPGGGVGRVQRGKTGGGKGSDGWDGLAEGGSRWAAPSRRQIQTIFYRQSGTVRNPG
jgi:hypothetical protein